jgi:hypothetical protein
MVGANQFVSPAAGAGIHRGSFEVTKRAAVACPVKV